MNDKAKVPIVITVAKKQTPLFMHMEYQVTLPDHDLVVGYKHKLIPSVIGDMKVVKSKNLTNDAVNYSSPTYIAIMSAKHSSSSAFHHLRDMNRVRSLPDFTGSFQDKSSKEQKVMIVTVDGGPDEISRYTNTINCLTDYFNEHDLDAYLVATNAPFNRVKRRMSNLSKELSGVILPYDHLDTHIDNNNNTLFQNVALKGNILPKHISTNFPTGIPNDCSYPSTKDAILERVCKHCSLYFSSIKPKQNHSANCRSKKSDKSSDKQSTRPLRKVQPQRIEARLQKELFCAMAF